MHARDKGSPSAGRHRGAVLLLALVLASALACSAVPAGAQALPEQCVGELNDAEVGARIDRIQRELDRQRKPSRTWWIGWMTGLAAVGVGQTTFAFLNDNTNQTASSAVGATGSFLGVASLLLRSLPSVHAADRLRRAPAGTPAERRQKLALAHRLLQKSADRQRQRSSPWLQVQLAGWLAATGLLLNLRWGATREWLVMAAGSIAVFEARLLTQPTGAIAAWDGYRHGSRPCMAPSLRSAYRPRKPPIDVALAPAPGGIGVHVRF